MEANLALFGNFDFYDTILQKRKREEIPCNTKRNKEVAFEEVDYGEESILPPLPFEVSKIERLERLYYFIFRKSSQKFSIEEVNFFKENYFIFDLKKEFESRFKKEIKPSCFSNFKKTCFCNPVLNQEGIDYHIMNGWRIVYQNISYMKKIKDNFEAYAKFCEKYPNSLTYRTFCKKRIETKLSEGLT